MDYLPFNCGGTPCFFNPVSRRYEKFVHDINSNKSYDEWGEILKDHLIAAVLLDRILHHCTTLSIKGEKGGSMKW